MKELIFVYGSLINTESRDMTCGVSDWIPVVLNWYKRWWYFQNTTLWMSALWIVKDKNSHCNGILLEIEKDKIPLIDRREENYQRVKLSGSKIETDINLSGRKIWTYIVKDENIPSRTCPIVQSYVDVVIAWCLIYWSNFTDEFISGTEWWDWEWIDDRENPIYTKQVGGLPLARIDLFLKSAGVL